MNAELELAGLDGANPLAFMAALGTLRTLSLAWPNREVRLGWRISGVWRPIVSTAGGFPAAEEVIETLLCRLKTSNPALARWDNTNKISAEDYRAYTWEAAQQATPSDRTWADFAACLGSEAMHEDGVIQDTAFRTMSGAGHQDFVKFMRILVDLTEAEHLREALFGPWCYQDDKPSMRWDPMDDRRYALRWSDPSGDPILTIRGANRLAIEALPLFPAVRVGAHLETTGFRGRKSRDTFLTWPIWEPAVPVAVVTSLLALSELQNATPDRQALSRLGIREVYRAQRITVGKFRNFTVGKPT